MSIAIVVDKATGARIGVILGVGFAPADVTGPLWRFRAWRDQAGGLMREPPDQTHPRMHRDDVRIEARHSDKPLPELFVLPEHLAFIEWHEAFRAMPPAAL